MGDDPSNLGWLVAYGAEEIVRAAKSLRTIGQVLVAYTEEMNLCSGYIEFM